MLILNMFCFLVRWSYHFLLVNMILFTQSIFSMEQIFIHLKQCCTFFFQNEVLFKSWDEIFKETKNGTANIQNNRHIFSFDGKDVMTDDTW